MPIARVLPSSPRTFTLARSAPQNMRSTVRISVARPTDRALATASNAHDGDSTFEQTSGSSVRPELSARPLPAQSTPATELPATVDLISTQSSGCCMGGRSRALGEYSRLSGTIELRDSGSTGQTSPSAAYLVLKKPFRVDGEQVHELFVDSPRALEQGAEVQLNGRLDALPVGVGETGGRTRYALSGVSFVRPDGEPRFTGRGFLSGADEALAALFDRRPLMLDGPARLLVLDARASRAFIGSMGGFIMPTQNPFHGFDRQSPIEPASDTERAEIRIDAEGTVVDAESGEPLSRLTSDASSEIPSTTEWYVSDRTNTAYALESKSHTEASHRVASFVRLA